MIDGTETVVVQERIDSKINSVETVGQNAMAQVETKNDQANDLEDLSKLI